MIRKNLMLEENKYIEQYHTAINNLMDENNIELILYPLINLILQIIEIEIKSLIAEVYYDTQTMKEFKIDNTHDLEKLVENSELKKYYEDINDFENIFGEYKKNILYFYNILGENSFLNSRYPIERTKNKITVKNKDIDLNEFKEKWLSYCEIYQLIMKIYIAYSLSNAIHYLKDINKSKEEIEIFKIKYVNESLEEAEEIDKITVYIFLEKFMKRDKYIDYKYVQ